MKSTGEVMGIDEDFGRAYSKAQASSNNTMPLSGKVFISVKDKDKPALPPIVSKLITLGFSVVATRGTASYLKKRDLEFWTWKAQKALIRKEMLLANTIRVSQAKQDQYSRFFDERRTELARLDGRRSEVHDEAWELIKMKRKG